MAENCNCHDVTQASAARPSSGKKRHVRMTHQVGTWPNVKDTAITKTIGWRDVTFIICLFALPQEGTKIRGGKK